MSSKRILIADDEENMLITLQFILESAGYKVSTATNGKQAIGKILAEKEKNDPFDLLIVDIQMPYMTGLELIDELRCSGIFIPFIAMTGFDSEELAREISLRGCDEYIEKPFNEDELINFIEKQLS